MANDVETSVVIINQRGLHARPATKLMEVARRFSSKITILCDGQTADGKSVLDLLTLGVRCGTEIRIRASGEDAQNAVQAVVELVQARFSEEEEPVR